MANRSYHKDDGEKGSKEKACLAKACTDSRNSLEAHSTIASRTRDKNVSSVCGLLVRSSVHFPDVDNNGKESFTVRNQGTPRPISRETNFARRHSRN